MATLLPAMLGGSVIIESIFSIPGMGLLAFEAVTTRDYNIVMAVATIGGVLNLIGLLLGDIAYAITDPRTKSEGSISMSFRIDILLRFFVFNALVPDAFFLNPISVFLASANISTL